MDDDYKTLVDQYKSQSAGMSQREMAILERRIWQLASPTLARTPGALLSKREWLSNTLETTPYAIEGRSTLLGYGDAADELWQRIAEGMPLRTCVKLMRDAKMRSAVNGSELRDEIQKMLKEYDELPTAVLPDGKVIHKRPPNMMPKPTEEPPEESAQDDDPKLFWANLRGMISVYFHTRLSGIDQGIVEKLWRDFEVDLKVLLDHFQHKLDRTKRDDAHRKQAVTRSQVIQACHTLHMEPPPGKIDAEFKKRAKRNYHKLAAVYHPDKSGTQDTRGLFDSVRAAYQILEDL